MIKLTYTMKGKGLTTQSKFLRPCLCARALLQAWSDFLQCELHHRSWYGVITAMHQRWRKMNHTEQDFKTLFVCHRGVRGMAWLPTMLKPSERDLYGVLVCWVKWVRESWVPLHQNIQHHAGRTHMHWLVPCIGYQGIQNALSNLRAIGWRHWTASWHCELLVLGRWTMYLDCGKEK